MSIKINAMVDDVKANNKDYKIMPRSIIKKYLKKRFTCTDYMANKAVTKLFEDE